MIKKAVVLAAGKGTRLRPITHAVPKEIVRVGKKPTIEHVLNVLKAGGVEDVLIVVGRNKHAIIDYLGSGERLDLDIYYRVQEEPKGSPPADEDDSSSIGAIVERLATFTRAGR